MPKMSFFLFWHPQLTIESIDIYGYLQPTTSHRSLYKYTELNAQTISKLVKRVSPGSITSKNIFLEQLQDTLYLTRH